jgi:hypothetical protein
LKLPPKNTPSARAPQARAKPLAKPLAEHASSEDKMQPVEPNAVLLRLVAATVTSRIRHRALLDVLGSGPYDYERYVARVKEIRERDYQALFAYYMLKKNDFNTVFGDWYAEDLERYRLDRESEPKPARKTRAKKAN